MQLQELLESKRTEIVECWARLALAVYPEGADGFLGREKDPFRNPVGHVTRQNLETLFDALSSGRSLDQIGDPLDGIVRIRAIQELTPTQAVGFVFLLKRALDEELGEALADRSVRDRLSDLHARIDQLALEAFERFVKCREAIYDLRAREAKRQTWALLKRLEKLPAGEGAVARSDAAEDQPKGGDGA